MNPQKYAEHTALNHSLLWRKVYTFEKPDQRSKPKCHKQVNQLAQTGVSWKARNSMIQTNFSGLKEPQKSFKKSYESLRVSKVLTNEHNQSPQTKNLKKSLIVNSDVLERSKMLIQGMQKLRNLKLISNKDLQQIKYPGIIRHAHVHNDYHERVTNPGFSRGMAGKHFAK